MDAVPLAVAALLRSEERVTYRVLRQLFGIDETFLATVRDTLACKWLARDEQGKGLVWPGEASTGRPPPLPVPPHDATHDTTSLLPMRYNV